MAKPTHWRHRCPELHIGRTQQTAWRAVLKGQPCELCNATDPKATVDRNRAKREGRLKAHGLMVASAQIPRAYHEEFQAFAETLRHRYAESQTLCEGQYEHIISNGTCLRCKQEL